MRFFKNQLWLLCVVVVFPLGMAGVTAQQSKQAIVEMYRLGVASAKKGLQKIPVVLKKASQGVHQRMVGVQNRVSRRLGNEVLDAAIERSLQFVREHPGRMVLYGLNALAYTVLVIVVARQVAALLHRKTAQAGAKSGI